MPIFATKMLAAGFAVSMAFSGSTASQSPNANISPATSYLENKPAISFSYHTLLDSWIEKLIVLESDGKKDLMILDHNGELSFGCLQFQKQTFEEFGLKYNVITPSDDIDELIYNCDLQKETAKRMIQENYRNWRHWYTSVMIKKLGLPPREHSAEIELAKASSK